MTKRPDDKRPRDEQRNEGDVLGISESRGKLPIPKPGKRGGHPKGIDVRREQHGSRDVTQSKGATPIDMGEGGEGHDVKRDD